jgi:hypothetical protein
MEILQLHALKSSLNGGSISTASFPHRLTYKTGPIKVRVTLRLTVSQSASLVVEPHRGLMTRYLLLF